MAGPSGYQQKKPRTISSTEFLQVSSGGAEVVEMSGVSGSGQDNMESDSSTVHTGHQSHEERREVESSSSFAGDIQETVGTSSGGNGDMAATSSQEEIMLDSELDDEEGEISEGLVEGDSQELNTEVMEGTTDEEENNVQDDDIGVHSEGEIELDVGDHPEVVGEDNSSEPSSSTGAGRVDPGDSDSVVPTTPKLPLPRRNDGFAEAVSSPQVMLPFIFIYLNLAMLATSYEYLQYRCLGPEQPVCVWIWQPDKWWSSRPDRDQ